MIKILTIAILTMFMVYIATFRKADNTILIHIISGVLILFLLLK